ncbi:GNAT family N-acetyltransferase [Sinosporangium album]|nr:GNAT family N-acetyltransferase [Sinosporangium album]
MTVVEVPQWQGSSSATAERLREGAAILADLTHGTERITVEAGPALAQTAARAHAVFTDAAKRFTVTVGGDCGVELAPVSAAVREHGDDLAVVWFDAHADLNTPDTSPSGAFHGMVLRTLLGEGPPDLLPPHRLRPQQVILAGARALDPAEQDYVNTSGITHISKPDMSALIEAVRHTGARAVYIHIDLDVLDPDTFASVGVPEPSGFLPYELITHVSALAERFEIIGLGITEYEPARPEDHVLLTKLIPELVRHCRASTPWQIEQRAALAWPAPIIEKLHGWLLRHTPGVTRKRTNSALPPYQISADVDRELQHIVSFYEERDLSALIQVSPAEHHTQLDELLAHRGYRRAAPTLALTAAAHDVITATTPTVEVRATDDPATMAKVFTQLDGNPGSTAVATDIVGHAPPPAAMLTAVKDAQLIGMALLVANTGWTGIFSMTTSSDHRRTGVGGSLLHAAAQWAIAHAAPRLYLQVEEDNTAAHRLYTRSGFTHSHSYHYRVFP